MNQFLSLMCVVSCLFCEARTQAADRPNIVFVMVDDMGYGDLPCYGATDVRTPNIDRLASQGVRLTSYYAAGAECTPTRTALLSGVYPQRIGGMECAIGTGNVGRYDDAIRLRESHDLGLPAEQAVLASTIKKAGYSTAMFGKWHLGYEKKHNPLNYGFDRFFGFLGGYVDYYRHLEFSDLDVLYENRNPIQRRGYMTHLINDQAVAYVDQQTAAKPFFMYVAYSVPHFPFQPPNSDTGKMVAKDLLTKGTRQNYVKMLEDMDAGVGRITKALDKKGLAKNTLFVFASDHGAILPGSNAPFRGFKSGLFEGGIRTACILQWPGHLAAGSVSDQPTITMDLTRSFINAAEKSTAARDPTVKQSHDGIDIVSHLAEKKPALSRAMFWRAKRGDRVWRAARDGSWKYVTRRENGKFEEWVFDLSKDPAEQNNLLKAERKQAKRLATMLSIWEAATQHSR